MVYKKYEMDCCKLDSGGIVFFGNMRWSIKNMRWIAANWIVEELFFLET
jgi:hypothetical protein